VKDHITGLILAMDTAVCRNTDMVMPKAIIDGIDINWICGRKTRPRWRDLAFIPSEVTKPMLLECLSECQNSILLRGRIIGKFDSEFSIETN